MKINAKIFSTFLNKVFVGGSITDGKLSFRDDGLHINVKDITKTGAITGVLASTAFQDYTTMDVNVRDTTKLLNTLRDMDDTIELSINKNAFMINSTGISSEIMMPRDEFLECHLGNDDAGKLEKLKTSYDEGFELDADLLMKAKRGSQNYGAKSVIASVSDSIFSIRAGEDEFDKISYKTTVSYKDVSARYGSTFLEFIGIIKGRITLSFNQDYPVFITQRDENSTVCWMASPIISEESLSETPV